MFSEGDAGDVKNVALEPLFVLPDQTHTRRSPDQRETHLKVGKLAFNFAGSSHSSSVPNN